jgi:hypothetical protein
MLRILGLFRKPEPKPPSALELARLERRAAAEAYASAKNRGDTRDQHQAHRRYKRATSELLRLERGSVAVIELPFPPSSLSGHAKGHWRAKAAVTAKHRGWAKAAALAAKVKVPADGDIRIHVRFVPPDRRGDRTNFPNRMKAYLDGIAEALGVNDARFLPSYEFAEPVKPGKVVVTVALQGGDQ